MTGRETLRETKGQVRQAFADEGLDVERWLDEQMTKLNRESPPAAEAIRSLQLLRNSFRAEKKSKSASKVAKKSKRVT